MEGLLRSRHLNDKAGLSDKAVQFPIMKQALSNIRKAETQDSQSDTKSHLGFKKQDHNIMCGQGEAGAKTPPGQG